MEKKLIFKKLIMTVLVSTIFINSYAENSTKIEHIVISPQMKKKILNSPFKAILQKKDGTKIIAYLYADDEQEELVETDSNIDGTPISSVTKVGHYFVYLFETNHNSLLPFKIKIFKDYEKITLNIEGAAIIVLPGSLENKSDVLLISQRGSWGGDYFEAYGFIDNNPYLQSYTFIDKDKQDTFYGRITESKTDPKLYAYGLYGEYHGDLRQFTLSLSDKPGEILVTEKHGDK